MLEVGFFVFVSSVTTRAKGFLIGLKYDDMILESIRLVNFRSFGPDGEIVKIDKKFTALIGNNGTGKTALMHGMLRMFGVNNEQRRIRRQDFHISPTEAVPPAQRNFALEAIFSFPEILGDGENHNAIPQFFQQMAADDNGVLKCRLQLTATWIDDASLDGLIEQKFLAIRTLSETFEDHECSNLSAMDRTRIQMIYVPATRDGASQLTSFLKGRLWKSISWSSNMRNVLTETGSILNATFEGETAVSSIAENVKRRWQEVHFAGTDTKPVFRPLDLRFPEFVGKVEVIFHPDEEGRDRNFEDLSDGQRSLFHLSLTAATIDIENRISSQTNVEGFHVNNLALPALTIIAIEEPENNLSPFYLSRIVNQIQDVTNTARAQAIVSSHSPSILARVEPEQIRYFRMDSATRSSKVRSIDMPTDAEDAAKFVREAVRTYPELYFARFVIFGEGSSEEVVIPRVAEAMNVPIDRSFVAIVPLGGRHVNHLWKLLNNLEIPFATLLDADIGRSGGGWGRIKTACEQLISNGVDANELLRDVTTGDTTVEKLETIRNKLLQSPGDLEQFNRWIELLRNHGIFFCVPLDLDWTMLNGMLDRYSALPTDATGPREVGDAKSSVLGEHADPLFYGNTHDDKFRWYRYLFLGRSKPSTHVRVLGNITNEQLRDIIPEVFRALVTHVSREVFGEPRIEN